MNGFLEAWGEAAYTSIGFFWMALWAFALGYVVSSAIQVLVTRERMKRSLGRTGPKSVGLAMFFGLISSSCSFAALATTKSLFRKGAGLVPSLAFLLASTNLVIELGIIIAVFLSWQFVVGEYVGGILLVLFCWLFVRLTRPKKMIEKARDRIEEKEGEDDGKIPDWKKLAMSREGWERIGAQYTAEWRMVWKDVTVGFTVAGIIAAFVPPSFFQWLFIGTGGENLTFFQTFEHALVGPVAAFCTFIGSMGNIPLAALLYDNGVSMAGIMAFIFSDLVVFPVLRINAMYYGWKMSLYILLALLTALVAAALILHYGFDLLGLSPETGGASGGEGVKREFFSFNYTFVLDIIFVLISALLVRLGMQKKEKGGGGHKMADRGAVDRILYGLALLAFVWLGGGLVARFVAG